MNFLISDCREGNYRHIQGIKEAPILNDHVADNPEDDDANNGNDRIN